MKTVKDYLHSLSELFGSNRRSGTTTLIKKIAEKEDVIVIVVDDEHKKEFKGDVYSLTDILGGNFLGKKNKPILVDNGAMIKLLSLCIDHTNILENMISLQELTIDEIGSIIRRDQKSRSISARYKNSKENLSPDYTFWL